MKNWLLPYGIWYALTAWAVFTAVQAAVSGDIIAAVLPALLGTVLGVIVIRSQVRWFRYGENALRAEMIRLIDARAAAGPAAWLHRDEHLLFNAERRRVAGMRGRTLLVIDEEHIRDIGDMRYTGGGKITVASVSYGTHPLFPRVIRRADGTTAWVTASDIETDPSEHESWWQWRGYAGMIRAVRAGHAFADTAELARVVAQFRDAEPVGREDPQ